MAKLYFKVASDWEEVVRLRNEIERLKQALKGMDSTQSPATFKSLNTQLSTSTQRMNELVTNAAKAGAEMENGFKKKIFDASQVVNGLSEKITFQRGTIQQLKNELFGLKDKYREALKQDGDTSSLEAKIRSTNEKLKEQKSTLFDLTQEQANARLSVKKLRDEYELYNNDGKKVVETNEGIAISWKKALAVIGGVAVLKALGSEIIRVRGEFQSMQTAIETMVGKDMAGQLIPQIKELAKISPLTMSDMVGAEKMMLGFNIQAEDTIKYLKAISDISMGESSKFNSLTLAFSQMSAAGKLMGQDLNQMINAGFNPLQIISEKTGKSIATLKDEMSKGAISAEMVQQAFIDATSAGGKFYNMSENASKTINGQLSMMQDALDNAFNEMGQKSEGVIMKGIQMTTSLIQNYETVGKILAGLVATYGTYRTAVMLVTAAESKHTLVEIGLTNARILARKAQLALNAAMLTNPYVLLATAVVGLGAAMWAFHDSTTAAEKAQKRFNEKQKEAAKQEQEHKQKIDSLVESSRDIALADLQRGQSLAELRKEYPKIFDKYDIETIKLADILKLKREIAEEDAKRAGEKKEKEFSDIEKEIKYYENLLKSLSGQQGVDGYVKKLKELRATRDVMLQDKGKGISEQFISSLKDIDISEFDRYISELEKRIKGQSENGKIKLRLPIDVKGSLSDEAIYEVKDIKTLIDTAKSTKQTRIDADKNKTTYQEDLVKAKKDWEKAKKGYETLLKDQKATSEQVKNARDEIRAKEKAYKDLGGITGSSLTKQENQADKLRKDQQKSAEELLTLRRQNQQDEISLMKEGTQKKLSQIDLDYQKELDTIEKQRTEWEKTQKGKLTSEQESQLSISEEYAFKAYQKRVSETNKEKLESDRKAWQEYFIQFGNYQEKRKNLIQKYDDEIAKLEEHSAERATKIAEKNQAIDQLDEQFGKSTHVMADLFEDASEKSVSSIQDIIDKYELLIKYMSGTDESVSLINLKSVGFTDKDIANLENGTINIKDITDAIKRLKEEVKGKSPWLSFFSDMKKGIDDIKNANGDTRKLGQGISTIGGAITEFSPAIKQFGSDISSIFGEDLNDEINNVIDGLSGLGQTAVGVGQIMSGDIAGGIMSAVSGVSQLVNAMGNLFGPDGTAYYEGVKEQLEAINEVYDRIIDKSKEDIVFGGGFASVQAATQAMDNYEKKVINLQKIAAASGRAGASWKSHSAEWHSNKNVGAIGGFEQMSDILGKSISSMTDLYSLSGDELFLIQSQMPEAWSLIDARIRENLDSIVACKDEANELRDALNQAMTGVDFDSFYNGFIDQLSDMDTSFEDMCDNFEDYLRKSIMAGLVASQYQNRINALYEQWSDAARSDSKITKNEADLLKEQYQQIVEDMMRDREEMFKTFRWDTSATSQESSKKGFATTSQDSIDELNGRFIALQISGEEIKNQSMTQSQSLNILTMKTDTLISINTETRNIADDTRDLIASSYLELVQISENTGAIIKPIQQMQKDMAEVKNNTKGLSTK
jgi:tape measure domain-containing protein|uniref:Tail tape measure protein n=1 Tax=Siphoviridae sp. ctXbO14 TaxID=2827579 RepID=A0A8S5LKW0_9CAUD|nr:MAG TPA: tail tape measure protein [Siphoviridae sp. ctXbO14]